MENLLNFHDLDFTGNNITVSDSFKRTIIYLHKKWLKAGKSHKRESYLYFFYLNVLNYLSIDDEYDKTTYMKSLSFYERNQVLTFAHSTRSDKWYTFNYDKKCHKISYETLSKMLKYLEENNFGIQIKRGFHSNTRCKSIPMRIYVKTSQIRNMFNNFNDPEYKIMIKNFQKETSLYEENQSYIEIKDKNNEAKNYFTYPKKGLGKYISKEDYDETQKVFKCFNDIQESIKVIFKHIEDVRKEKQEKAIEEYITKHDESKENIKKYPYDAEDWSDYDYEVYGYKDHTDIINYMVDEENYKMKCKYNHKFIFKRIFHTKINENNEKITSYRRYYMTLLQGTRRIMKKLLYINDKETVELDIVSSIPQLGNIDSGSPNNIYVDYYDPKALGVDLTRNQVKSVYQLLQNCTNTMQMFKSINYQYMKDNYIKDLVKNEIIQNKIWNLYPQLEIIILIH